MDEPIRWVTKAEATEELDISLSTLDRMIRKGDVEVSREGRRVFVRMHGPADVTDEDLLRQAIVREDELERTVRELKRTTSELERGASELERERDEAREAVSRWKATYSELEETYGKEDAAHGKTKWLALRLGLVAAALFVYSVLVTWRLLA